MPKFQTPHTRRDVLASAALAAATLAMPRVLRAQTAAAWPDQPVRMILPYAPGGPTDVIARLICDTLSQRLPQRVVVENRTGAGGNIGASAAAKSRPDGATLLFTNTGHAVNRALYAKLDYDPVKDLTPVTIVAEGPMVLLVPNSSPAKTLAEFVERVRAKPGEYAYGSTGTGGALQLVSLLLTKAAGLKMEEVPYRGSAPAAQDLIAGRVEMLYDAGVTGFPLATAGQARALVVSSAQRSAVMPDVPTVAEAGYSAATFSVWQGIMAPAGTPASIVEKVREEVAAILAEGTLRQRLTELGAERIVTNTPAEAKTYVEAEMVRWEQVLREAGVKPQ
ncbi:tripartite tricarboxylate transporter substrate binding protein [Pseudoroseomonas wenyumeiae]|uniref:Tripartite tricarboxylate transporter substrate binding protein n=1 Tax=Teichococcus wenyumeiae TaxID=2478470 RepID=A0A3A9K3C3_9PROT|nr:tripartite tricarboxylate transporter substrate binding protein [Pseudoroseomonas wenyumeiae]RKK05869.1 tripartite tricarboxylate transporter substrate binding protein [Pseudoroseomonas wenyumeiae]RMI25902.1 tripartite tricarboxylate transporter substrate binding protein [Pseudoroseomonas wenyumeiae]